MKKYFQIFKLTIQEYFAYRLNFLLWRLRSFVFTISLLFFWLAVYGNQETLFGYQKSQMITYLLGVAFLDSIVLASRTADLAGQIRHGEISKFLVRPLGLFKFLLSRDFADKALNLSFVILEILLITRILNFSLYFPKDFLSVIIFVIHILISFALAFFMSIVINTFAFWTEEVWATRWLLGVVLLDFLSGAIFPIDILPSWLAKIVYLTPFPYLIFSPLKIWLGQLSSSLVLRSLAMSLFWLVSFYLLAEFLWKKGMKKYGAYGG